MPEVHLTRITLSCTSRPSPHVDQTLKSSKTPSLIIPPPPPIVFLKKKALMEPNCIISFFPPYSLLRISCSLLGWMWYYYDHFSVDVFNNMFMFFSLCIVHTYAGNPNATNSKQSTAIFSGYIIHENCENKVWEKLHRPIAWSLIVYEYGFDLLHFLYVYDISSYLFHISSLPILLKKIFL